METKICTACRRELPVSSFSKNIACKDGLNTKCKECVKKSRSRNKIVIPQQGVKATFKISDFNDDMLFAELRRRGYTGELRFTRLVNV